jgi:4-amino-4-deoxy-L-arabinose transferase-like glycosyltransferase
VSLRDRLIALALFCATAAVTLAAAPSQGIHRDEAYYMVAGEQYVTYWEKALTGELAAPLSDASIRRFWDYNHEHPPLMKLLYGVAWRLFHRCECAAEATWHPGPTRLEPGEQHLTIPLFDWESTAFRLPTILCFAWLVVLVFRFFRLGLAGTTPLPLVGAIGAALLAAAQPRAFFHAQTASFDLPAATFWIATTLAYWRALQAERPWRAALGVGLLYGLFLATKLQSFFLPAALGVHWLFLVWSRKRRGEKRPSIAPLVAMATLAPLVFFLSWPWLWHDTFRRFGAYLSFHLTHVHYNFEYLGVNHNTPPYPWHEPLGMLLFTAPVILLALAAAGIAILVKRAPDPRGTRALLLLAGFVPISLFLYGRTPIFGETKHWLATMPILALCAGVALQTIAAGLAEKVRFARLAGAALVVIAFAPAFVETARSHPYGLSHYNALAGGAPGGADLGMNRQFWGYSVAGLLPWLNRELPPDTPLYLHDWNHDAYLIYLRDGRLRSDIRDAGMEQPGVDASRASLVVLEKHFSKYEYMIWGPYQTTQPAEVLTLDGVPLVPVYLRR